MATYSSDAIRSVFVTGLKNAHAVEHQALGLIDRQLDRIENFPEIADRLRLHRGETEQQIVRLGTIFDQLGESNSTLKDTALSLSGNLAALTHSFAEDEILKNSFANVAFEHFEASAYKSLITLADAGGFASATPLLQETLREELSMADWVDQRLPDITLRYLSLHQSDAASH